MPSPESAALRELFLTFAANFPQDGNTFLERCVYDQVQQAGADHPSVSIEDVTIDANGFKVPCKWFRPAGTEQAQHVMLFMHGGGFSFGSPNGHRKLAAHLAAACGCAALSVDYRLAPEHKYPAALDDCVAAYSYLMDSGYSASRIVIAGDSCGGGLTANVPVALLRRNIPQPGACVAMSPCYDLTTQDGGTMDTNEEVDVLNAKPFCRMLADRYANSEEEKKDACISGLYASNEELKHFPPTWISVAGYDMLADHGTRFGERLEGQGVEAVVVVSEGMQHVFEFLAGKAPEADDSIRNIGKWVKEKIGA